MRGQNHDSLLHPSFLLHLSSCHYRWGLRKWPEQRALRPSDSAKSIRQWGRSRHRSRRCTKLPVALAYCQPLPGASGNTAASLAWVEPAEDSQTYWIQNPSLLVELESVLVCAAVSFHSIWNGFFHLTTSITSRAAVVNIRLWLYSFLPFPGETCPHPLKTHSRPGTGQYRQNHISN